MSPKQIGHRQRRQALHHEVHACLARQHRVVLYASEAAFIDFAVDNEKGWRELEVPPMTMLTIRHADVRAITKSEFRFIPQERKGTLPEGVNA